MSELEKKALEAKEAAAEELGDEKLDDVAGGVSAETARQGDGPLGKFKKKS